MFFFLCCTPRQVCQPPLILDGQSEREEPTSNVIHDIGSSSGMMVFLTSLSVNASSSNSTVKMAPGGVQVPIIRWCFIATLYWGARPERALMKGARDRLVECEEATAQSLACDGCWNSIRVELTG